jgi:F-type H+-transporting ATPase subunit b
VISSSGLHAALPALLRVSEEGHEAARFLGVPMWVWQIVNLGLFFAVLIYFVARPLGEAFRKRQAEIEERRRKAEEQRASVDRLAADIRERTARIEKEIEEIRRQGRADGEQARQALTARATEEAERIRRGASEEIERRLSAARDELRRAAADGTASAAAEILAREITPADRERILADGVSRLKDSP